MFGDLALYVADNWVQIIRFSLIAILTLFILLSGFLLPLYLRGLQKQELERIESVFSAIGRTSAFRIAGSSAPTFRIVDYLTPVLFTTFIVFIFASMSIMAGNSPPPINHILAGNFITSKDVVSSEVNLYQAGTLVIIIFAFLGSFIWSVQYILGRVMTRDITPGEFYKIALNMIFAVILAVAIRHSVGALLGDKAGPDVVRTLMPPMGFLIGLFPNFFLEWLVKIFKQKWIGEQPKADSLDLYQIEGLSDSAIFRLRDLDVHNGQNLAFANPVTLYMRTKFGITEAMDWVDQAQLLTTFKFEQTEILRKLGFRTLSDIVCLAECTTVSPGALEQVATALSATPDRIRSIVACSKDDPAYLRLSELRAALREHTDA